MENMIKKVAECIRQERMVYGYLYIDRVYREEDFKWEQRKRTIHTEGLPFRECYIFFTVPSFVWDSGGGVYSLNVYTGQNPRRHVVLKNTSQMRTICTQFGRNLSVYLSLHVSFFPGGGIFLQIHFSLVKCPSIITFIPSKIRLQYSWIPNLQKKTTPKNVKMTPEPDLLVINRGLKPRVTLG